MTAPDLLAPCPAIQPVAWHLSVGVGIGILGFLGVVVPLIRDHFGRREKATWTALFAVLLFLELRSIRLDEIQHDREQAFVACEQQRSFQEIAGALSSAISANQEHFDTTIKHVDEVLATTEAVGKLTAENLSNTTGGDSYAYLNPQGSGPVVALSMHNYGANILSGVSVTIMNLQDPNWTNEIQQPIAIGTIAPHGFATVPVAIAPQPDPKTGIASYWIFINAQNGSVDEMLKFRRSKRNPNALAYSLHVKRDNFFDRSGKQITGPKSITPLANFGWSDEQPAKPQ